MSVKMKTAFSHLLPPTEETTKSIWADAKIVLDTNVLLNHYRWSKETSDEFFQLLDGFKDRLWIPYQVAYEFFENREDVVLKAKLEYDDTAKRFEEFLSNLNHSRGHPHLSKELMGELEDLFKKASCELSESGKSIEKALSNDPTRERIASLFDGSVGAAPSDEEFENEFQKAATRYENGVPPGYMDADKAKGGKFSDKRRAYGDYLIWNSILQKAKDGEHNVILIIDDTKEDWWKKVKGRTIGPRPELLAEFFERTSKKIAIYRPDRFIELAKQFAEAEVSEEALSEVSKASNDRARAANAKAITNRLREAARSASEFDKKTLGQMRLTAESVHGFDMGTLEKLRAISESTHGLDKETLERIRTITESTRGFDKENLEQMRTITESSRGFDKENLERMRTIAESIRGLDTENLNILWSAINRMNRGTPKTIED